MSIVKTTHTIGSEEIHLFVELAVEESSEVPTRGDSASVPTKFTQISKDILKDGFQLIRDCAKATVQNIRALDPAARPDEFELQFMVKFDSEVGAILAKVQSGAQLQVTLKWTKKD